MTGDWLPPTPLLDALDHLTQGRHTPHTDALIALGWAEHTWAGIRLTRAGRDLYTVPTT